MELVPLSTRQIGRHGVSPIWLEALRSFAKEVLRIKEIECFNESFEDLAGKRFRARRLGVRATQNSILAFYKGQDFLAEKI